MTHAVFQNPVETHKDYSLLPLLAAAPQVGEKIAFKVHFKTITTKKILLPPNKLTHWQVRIIYVYVLDPFQIISVLCLACSGYLLTVF